MQSNKLFFTIWNNWFGHFNFQALKNHLVYHNIYYIDNKHICNSCKKAKAMKHYNYMPQKKVKGPYQYIYIGFIGPIMSIKFGIKRYFSIFTNDNIYILKTYTKSKKNKWLKSLKVFYNLIYTCISLNRPIKKLWSNYSLEPQSQKVNKWFIKQKITFELFVFYFQKKNKILKKTKKTIINMVRVTIFERKIDNMFWPKIILAMTHIKNLKLT